MKNFKKAIGMTMAAVMAVSMMGTLPAAAEEETPKSYVSSDDNWQEFSATLSVEDFTDLASEYGYSVTIGDEDIAEPQKHEYGSYTFSDNNYHQIGLDSVILHEEVQIQNIRFGSNVDSVDVMICVRTAASGPESLGIKNGGNSDIFSVTWGCQYRVFMRANSDSEHPLTKNNTCTVTYYWTDRGEELI